MRRDKEGRNRPALALHVPEPAARPGDAVDFSHIAIPAAGAAPRPDVSAQPGDIRDLAYSLVRVLDEEGRAVGHWDPRPDPDTLRRLLRAMNMVRVFAASMSPPSEKSRVREK